MRYAKIGALLMIAACTATASDTSQRKIPCKVPANTASCHWIHGRLAAYNGAPAFRLWEIGTHRLLGISSGPNATDPLDNEHPEFPASVRDKLKPFENKIVGDFEVCPLEQKKTGWMQAACIESAKKIVVAKWEERKAIGN